MSTNNFWTGSQILSKVQMSSNRLFILLAFLMSWSVVLSPSDLSRANASRNAFRENACCSALAILARSLQRLNSDVDDLFCAVAVTTTSTETFEGIFLTIQVALLSVPEPEGRGDWYRKLPFAKRYCPGGARILAAQGFWRSGGRRGRGPRGER